MVTRSSAENERAVADERAVRAFLEHAAPIILESRVLDGERFEAVCALADENGLTRDQLACELRLLEQRGVITTAPWDQLDDVVEPAGDESGAAAPRIAPAPDEPADVVPPVPSDAVPSDAVPSDAVPATPIPPLTAKPAGVPPESVEISTTTSAMEALRDRAQKILATRGAISPTTRSKLKKAGKQAGLNKVQIASVLNNLGDSEIGGAQAPTRRPPVPAPSDADADADADAKGPAAPSPSESFRRWIDQKLSGYSSSILGMDDENGLIGVGVHRYHLANVLSTHLVRDVATEHGIRLERDLDDASCNSTVGTSTQASADDQKLQEFFEEVAPILTQHRGINAKSRMMMNAVAERLGLTEAELERALATLQLRSGDPDESDPRQLERRESFRAYLRRTMAQLPRGIVTFKAQWRLCQAGEHFHGVAPKWIETTIKEVASEIGARFISKQQAVEHITELVEDQLSNRPVIDSTTRARIYTEGTQWGLDPMDVDAIIRQRTETLRQQLAAERRRSRWVINFVIGGVAVGGVILGAMLLVNPLSSTTRSDDGESVPVAKERPQPKQLRGMPWWDDTLRIAQARLRVTSPDLRPVLDRLVSEQPGQRAVAYKELVDQFAGKLRDRKRREDVEQLLVSLYQLETSDLAARALDTALLAKLDALDTGIPESSNSLDAIHWCLQVAVAMVKNPDTPVLRRNRLTEQLDAATDTRGDPLLDAEGLLALYGKALTQRLYQALTKMAEDDPEGVEQYYGTVQTFAEKSVSDTMLDQLEIDFLKTILPVVDDRWSRYGDTIRRASRSPDPNTVIKLLTIYRRSGDDLLRNFLATLFFDRLGAAPGTLTESEMIDGIRESLGVASKERDYGRWQLLTSTADDLFSRERVERTNPDVLVQESIELAHAATLACALSRGESGGKTFDEMQTEGPIKLALGSGPWSTESPNEYKSTYPVPRKTVLESNINNLMTARTVGERVSLLQLIANQTGSVPDIDLQAGQTLAKYLVRFKADENEHRQMLGYIKRLGRWNAVLLGLADQLLEVTGRDTQLEQLLAKLLENDFDLTTDGEREKIRSQLLARVLGAFTETPDTDDPRFRVFDEGGKAILDLYARQAKLLGVPEQNYQDARRPSAVVITLVNHLAAQLSGTKLEAADRAIVDSLTYRLKATDFVAENDMQYTVALQQVWLQLLAIHMARQVPEKMAAIRQIRDGSGSPKGDQRVFEQLRDVQTDLLRLWMLLRPQFEEMELDGFDVSSMNESSSWFA